MKYIGLIFFIICSNFLLYAWGISSLVNVCKTKFQRLSHPYSIEIETVDVSFQGILLSSVGIVNTESKVNIASFSDVYIGMSVLDTVLNLARLSKKFYTEVYHNLLDKDRNWQFLKYIDAIQFTHLIFDDNQIFLDHILKYKTIPTLNIDRIQLFQQIKKNQYLIHGKIGQENIQFTLKAIEQNNFEIQLKILNIQLAKWISMFYTNIPISGDGELWINAQIRDDVFNILSYEIQSSNIIYKQKKNIHFTIDSNIILFPKNQKSNITFQTDKYSANFQGNVAILNKKLHVSGNYIFTLLAKNKFWFPNHQHRSEIKLKSQIQLKYPSIEIQGFLKVPHFLHYPNDILVDFYFTHHPHQSSIFSVIKSDFDAVQIQGNYSDKKITGKMTVSNINLRHWFHKKYQIYGNLSSRALNIQGTLFSPFIFGNLNLLDTQVSKVFLSNFTGAIYISLKKLLLTNISPKDIKKYFYLNVFYAKKKKIKLNIDFNLGKYGLGTLSYKRNTLSYVELVNIPIRCIDTYIPTLLHLDGQFSFIGNFSKSILDAKILIENMKFANDKDTMLPNFKSNLQVTKQSIELDRLSLEDKSITGYYKYNYKKKIHTFKIDANQAHAKFLFLYRPSLPNIQSVVSGYCDLSVSAQILQGINKFNLQGSIHASLEAGQYHAIKFQGLNFNLFAKDKTIDFKLLAHQKKGTLDFAYHVSQDLLKNHFKATLTADNFDINYKYNIPVSTVIEINGIHAVEHNFYHGNLTCKDLFTKHLHLKNLSSNFLWDTDGLSFSSFNADNIIYGRAKIEFMQSFGYIPLWNVNLNTINTIPTEELKNIFQTNKIIDVPFQYTTQIQWIGILDTWKINILFNINDFDLKKSLPSLPVFNKSIDSNVQLELNLMKRGKEPLFMLMNHHKFLLTSTIVVQNFKTNLQAEIKQIDRKGRGYITFQKHLQQYRISLKLKKIEINAFSDSQKDYINADMTYFNNTLKVKKFLLYSKLYTLNINRMLLQFDEKNLKYQFNFRYTYTLSSLYPIMINFFLKGEIKDNYHQKSIHNFFKMQDIQLIQHKYKEDLQVTMSYNYSRHTLDALKINKTQYDIKNKKINFDNKTFQIDNLILKPLNLNQKDLKFSIQVDINPALKQNILNLSLENFTVHQMNINHISGTFSHQNELKSIQLNAYSKTFIMSFQSEISKEWSDYKLWTNHMDLKFINELLHLNKKNHVVGILDMDISLHLSNHIVDLSGFFRATDVKFNSKYLTHSIKDFNADITLDKTNINISGNAIQNKTNISLDGYVSLNTIADHIYPIPYIHVNIKNGNGLGIKLNPNHQYTQESNSFIFILCNLKINPHPSNDNLQYSTLTGDIVLNDGLFWIPDNFEKKNDILYNTKYNLDIDVILKIQSNVTFKNFYILTNVFGEMHLSGPLQNIKLDGKFRTYTGEIFSYRNLFEIDEALLEIKPYNNITEENKLFISFTVQKISQNIKIATISLPKTKLDHDFNLDNISLLLKTDPTKIDNKATQQQKDLLFQKSSEYDISNFINDQIIELLNKNIISPLSTYVLEKIRIIDSINIVRNKPMGNQNSLGQSILEHAVSLQKVVRYSFMNSPLLIKYVTNISDRYSILELEQNLSPKFSIYTNIINTTSGNTSSELLYGIRTKLKF